MTSTNEINELAKQLKQYIELLLTVKKLDEARLSYAFIEIAPMMLRFSPYGP
jgi:hypothetical protein